VFRVTPCSTLSRLDSTTDSLRASERYTEWTKSTLTALLKYYEITDRHNDMKVLTQYEEIIICIHNFNQKNAENYHLIQNNIFHNNVL
jgi:flagellar biosynthesis/type III secretory pathway chaperone